LYFENVLYSHNRKRWENVVIPPVNFSGGQLKIKMVFCSKRAVLLATE